MRDYFNFSATVFITRRRRFPDLLLHSFLNLPVRAVCYVFDELATTGNMRDVLIVAMCFKLHNKRISYRRPRTFTIACVAQRAYLSCTNTPPMKPLLLLLFFTVSATVRAQSVSRLPEGTYQIQNGKAAFKGDIILVDDSHYKLSTEGATGEYKFSATAQRILFLSGTLKGAFARTELKGTDPIIMLPLKENADIGFKLVQTDLQAFYKKN